MLRTRLQQYIGQIQDVNPEELELCAKSCKLDNDPELTSLMLATRERLRSLLAIFDKFIEGDYRSAPIIERHANSSTENTALQKVEQPAAYSPVSEQEAQQAIQFLATIDDREIKEFFRLHINDLPLQVAKKKINLLARIKDTSLRTIIQNHYRELSVDAIESLSKLQETLKKNDEISAFFPDTYSDRNKVIREATEINKLTFDIISHLAEHLSFTEQYVQFFISKMKDLHRYEGKKPETYVAYEDIIHRKLSWLKFFHALLLAAANTQLPTANSEIMGLQVKGRDRKLNGLFGMTAPLLLCLALVHDDWPDRMKGNREREKYQHQLEQILGKFLPKFKEMPKWLGAYISGPERRNQLFNLLVTFIPKDVDSGDDDALMQLSSADCEKFLFFMNNPENSKATYQLSDDQYRAFILSRRYDHNTILKLISADDKGNNK